VEPIVDVDQQRHEKLVEQDMQRNLGREGPDAVAQVPVGGLQATESVYRDLERGGLKGTTVHAVLFQKNLCFQIITVWLGEKEGALEEVRKSYGFLSFLPKQERETLEEELLQSDPHEGVGKTFRLRNGVYCDFEHGFLYRKPRGLWRVVAGDAARAQSAVAVLVLTNPAQGVRIALIPERLLDTPHREYHQALLAARRAPEDTVIQSRRHGDLQFLVSKFHMESGTRTATFLTATAVRDERHVQVCLYGLQGNMAGIDQRLPEILGGLELPKEPPVAQVQGETIVQDFRLGYCLAAEEPGWQLRVFPVPDAGPGASTSVAVLARKNLECGITALCLPHLDDEAVLNAGFAAIALPPIEPENRT
jgi:hypothetical protein